MRVSRRVFINIQMLANSLVRVGHKERSKSALIAENRTKGTEL